jgi:hypothetical protein
MISKHDQAMSRRGSFDMCTAISTTEHKSSQDRTDSMDAKLLQAAIEKRLRHSISMRVSELGPFLLEFPVAKYANSLDYLKSEHGSLLEFLSR